MAVTRARDLAVLSARPQRGTQETWRGFVDQIRDEAVQRGLLRVLAEVPPPPPRPVAARTGRARRRALPAAHHPDVAAAPEQACRGRSGRLRAGDTARRRSLRALAATSCSTSCGWKSGPDRARPSTTPKTRRPPSRWARSRTGCWSSCRCRRRPASAAPELERLLALEGEHPARHAEVLDAACAFLDSALGRRMAAARAGELMRELPFALHLKDERVELLVRGQIDALLLDAGEATVIDYKLSQARDPDHYGNQLDAYALAAGELLREPRPVRTGIVFLRSPGTPFAARDPSAAGEVRARLLAAARAIAEGRRTGEWSGVAEQRCREIGCGFVSRCHGELKARS